MQWERVWPCGSRSSRVPLWQPPLSSPAPPLVSSRAPAHTHTVASHSLAVSTATGTDLSSAFVPSHCKRSRRSTRLGAGSFSQGPNANLSSAAGADSQTPAHRWSGTYWEVMRLFKTIHHSLSCQPTPHRVTKLIFQEVTQRWRFVHTSGKSPALDMASILLK